MAVTMSFLYSPNGKERAVKFIQITCIIKLEKLNLPPKLRRRYISYVSRTILFKLHLLPSFLAFLRVT